MLLGDPDEKKMREMVAGFIEQELDAVRLRAATYFVLPQCEDRLRRFAAVVNGIGKGAHLDIVGVATDEQRDYILSVADEVFCAALSDRIITSVITSAQPTPAAYAKARDLFARIAARAATCTIELEAALPRFAAAAEWTLDELVAREL